jgi:DNA-binding beta-propeller fold protein YncE
MRAELTGSHHLRSWAHGIAIALGALACTAAAAPAAALANGPDPTLVVASVPDPSAPPGSGNVVQTFDTATGSELGPSGGVPVGSSPFALAIDPTGSTAYVANNASGTVTPVTVSTTSAEATLCMPTGNCSQGGDPNTAPEAVAVTPGGTAAYVANSGENSVSVISITNGTAKVVSPQISSSSFSFPDAIAITPDGKTAWVANFGSGTVVPVSIPSGRVGTPVTVGLDPTALAITPDGRALLVADSGDGTVTDVSLTTGTTNTFRLEPTANGFVTPHAIAISPDGSTAYVTDTANNVVVPVAIDTDTAGEPVPVGTYPVAVVVSPDGSQAYVADEFSDQISVLDLTGASPSLSTTIDTNGSPDALALTPDQAPMASFSITPGTAGSPTSFDASASTTTPSGGSLKYTWNFGDGSAPSSTDSATASHTYANPGVYKVTLTVTDAAGTATTEVFTGQTASRNGGPPATTSQSFAVQGPSSGAAPEALVAGNGDASATPVALKGGAPPAATPGVAVGVGQSPSAVAIDPSGATAYVVDTGSNQVTPVDMTTGQAASPANWITVGSEPDAIAITPDGRRAYVVNGGDTTVSEITLRTHAVTTISVSAATGANLDAIAITPDGTKAYVLDAANNTITPITLASRAVGSPVGGSGLLAPDAIAIAPNGKTAYVVDGGSATQAGGLTTVNITGPSPAPTSTTAIDSASDHPDAIAINPAGGTAYVADAPTNGHTASVTPLSVSGTSVTRRTAVPVPNATALYGIAVTPDGASAYATGTTSSANVIVPLAVSGASVTPASPANLGSQPRGIAIAPDQAPVAELAASSPVAAGAAGTFDASASSNPSSPIASYTFGFGDGSATVTKAAPTDTTAHAYAVAGVYTATVTVTDQAGTSTAQVFTGQTASRNGGAGAVASQQVTVFPTVTAVNPTAGPTGTKVTITGTGFSTKPGTTTIAFGNKAATGVSCSSSTQCTATAPSATGTVEVTATVAGQTSPPVPGDQYTYTTGKPTVTHVDPSSGPAGTKVTITGTGFATASGQTIVRFGGTRSSSVTCPTDTACTATAPASVQASTGALVNIYVVVGNLTSSAVSADKFKYTP